MKKFIIIYFLIWTIINILLINTSIAESRIITKMVDFGHREKENRIIDTVIIHSTFNSLDKDIFNLKKILNIYKSYNVSPHYVIDRAGVIYNLVNEADIAYHSGISLMPNIDRDNVNDFSIGIELINSYTISPNKKQYDSLAWLIKCKLEKEHNIKYILGHKDISSDRKTDPYLFNWTNFNKIKKYTKCNVN